jgi:hypothetical protein
MACSSHTRLLDNPCVSSKVIWGVDLSRKTLLLVQSISSSRCCRSLIAETRFIHDEAPTTVAMLRPAIQ